MPANPSGNLKSIQNSICKKFIHEFSNHRRHRRFGSFLVSKRLRNRFTCDNDPKRTSPPTTMEAGEELQQVFFD
jgi:hypothetical protein